MNPITYLFLRFDIIQGDREHQHKVLIETKATNVKFAIMRYLSTYWGYGEYDRSSHKWSYDYGEIMLELIRYEEVTKEEYDYLTKFLI